ncbi:MAG: hypothetical protein HOO97_01985 [Sideroxydans sp.]|nr:hypothetical protein [Sideroxydans sp.]
MTPAKSLTVAASFWPLLELMADKQLVVTIHELRDLLEKYVPKEERSAQAILGLFEECGILEKAPGSDSEWELVHAFGDFFRHLSNRQRLASPGILISILEDISYQTEELQKAIEANSSDLVIARCKSVRDRLDEVRHVSESRHAAVIHEVMKIKARTDKRSVHERYDFISDMYLHHIEPLRSIINPGGEMDKRLNVLLLVIKKGLSDFSNDPIAPETLTRLSSAVIRLEKEALAHFSAAFKEVLPLYNQLRHDAQLARAVSKQLDAVSRAGCGTLVKLLQDQMPIARWRAESLFASGTMEDYLSSVSEYIQSAPEPLVTSSTSSTSADRYIDPFELLDRVNESKPIGDALRWLFEAFPDKTEHSVLAAFQEILQNDIQYSFESEMTSHVVGSATYHYFPVRIEV